MNQGRPLHEELGDPRVYWLQLISSKSKARSGAKFHAAVRAEDTGSSARVYSSCSMYLCLISFHCFYPMERGMSGRSGKQCPWTLTPLFQLSQKASAPMFKPTPNANAPPMIVLKNTPVRWNPHVSRKIKESPHLRTVSSAKGAVE